MKKISPVYSPANLNKHDSELIKVQSIDKVDLKEMESDYQGSPLMRPQIKTNREAIPDDKNLFSMQVPKEQMRIVPLQTEESAKEMTAFEQHRKSDVTANLSGDAGEKESEVEDPDLNK